MMSRHSREIGFVKLGWAAILLGLFLLGLFACGDDSTPPPASDAGRRDAGSFDAGAPRDAALPDAGAPPGDAGRDAGLSVIGMICANDDNCTGAGQVCCLAEVPSSCQLATECDGDPSGIPCTRSADCPSSRVCCRFPTETFCTPRRACADLGGEQLP
jgi:hypothetical protein